MLKTANQEDEAGALRTGGAAAFLTDRAAKLAPRRFLETPARPSCFGTLHEPTDIERDEAKRDAWLERRDAAESYHAGGFGL